MGFLLSPRASSTMSNRFFICSLEVGFLPFQLVLVRWQCCPFSEVFCKCSNALFASVKAGSEITENSLLSGSKRRKQWMAALRWISLMNFCKLTEFDLSSSLKFKTSSEKRSVLLLVFLLSVSKSWCQQD